MEEVAMDNLYRAPAAILIYFIALHPVIIIIIYFFKEN